MMIRSRAFISLQICDCQLPICPALYLSAFLCVLRVSAVNRGSQFFTAETQRTQRCAEIATQITKSFAASSTFPLVERNASTALSLDAFALIITSATLRLFSDDCNNSSDFSRSHPVSSIN